MYEWVNSIRGVQPRQRLVDLAKRRIKEEMESKGRLGGDDPYGQIVTSFVTRGNRVNDYDVASSCVSKHAIPLALLKQIRGETFMAWTGWVFRMRDGRVFSYGTPFRAEFLQLPDGYEFNDVVEVINHSFVDSSGSNWPKARRHLQITIVRRCSGSAHSSYVQLIDSV
jgi:hypothetical protein